MTANANPSETAAGSAGEEIPAPALTVLHIAPTPFFADRGAHIRIRGIALGLKAQGVNNIVCTYHLGRDVPGIETVRTVPIPGYTRLEAGPSGFKYLADILLFSTVCGVMLKQRPDVIHGHLHEGTLIGWVAKVLFFWRCTPLVSDVQGSLVGELGRHGYLEPRTLKHKIFWFLEGLIARMPQHFFCSSQGSADILVNEFRVPASKVEVIHDGAGLPCRAVQTSALRETLRLPLRTPIAIYTGGLLAAKGANTLHGALLEAERRGLRCHFLIIGYPDKDIREFVGEHSLGHRCTVVGRVPYDELGAHLALADVALEPKPGDSSEASGKLLNYMGAALPVVCFDGATNRLILGENGYFADSGSIDDFVNKIEEALGKPAIAAERGAQGRRRAEKRFGWNTSAKKVYHEYLALLRKH